jgi:hypothetical protein
MKSAPTVTDLLKREIAANGFFRTCSAPNRKDLKRFSAAWVEDAVLIVWSSFMGLTASQAIPLGYGFFQYSWNEKGELRDVHRSGVFGFSVSPLSIECDHQKLSPVCNLTDGGGGKSLTREM